MRKFFTLLVALLSISSAMANPVSEKEATTIAKKFFLTGRGAKAPIKDASKVVLAYEFQSDDATLMYAFNNGTDGYVLVSGDDSITPVLGYSDSGEFDYDALPANARAWFDMYAEKIKSVKEGKSAPFKNYPSASSVEPMIVAKWNQDYPYWNNTPLDEGEQSYTGCPATAMAQIAYYHKWPVKSEGRVDYQTITKNISISAELNTTFDWDNMLPTYDENSPEVSCSAVAELMRDLGYAMKMDYTSVGSGSTQDKIAYAIVNNFGYDEGMRILYAHYYDDEDWANLLQVELSAGRPILYCGATVNNEGHAFVCDGYDMDGLFHINWGWGGMSDGYFVITSLDPQSQGLGGAASGAGFNKNQMAFVGIQKPVENTVVAPYTLMYTACGLEVRDVALNFTFEDLINGGYGVFEGDLWFDIIASDNTVVKSVDLVEEMVVEVFEGFTFEMPIDKDECVSMLADGQYIIDFYTIDTNGTRVALETRVNPLMINKSGDKITVIYYDEIVPEAFEIERKKATKTTSEYAFTFAISNENSIAFNGEIGLLYSAEPDDSGLATSGPISGDIAPVEVSIEPGETKTISIPSGPLPNHMDYQLSLLTEGVTVRDNNFSFTSAGYAPIEFRDAKVVRDNQGHYSLSAKIVNISGEGETYDDVISCTMLTEFSAIEVYKSSSDKITLTPGESANMSINIDTKDIDYGDYRVVLNYFDNGVETIMYPAEENFISFVYMSTPQLRADNFSMICYDIIPSKGYYEFSYDITNESDQYYEGELYVSYRTYNSELSDYVTDKTPNKKVVIAPGKTVSITHSSVLEELQFGLVYEFEILDASNKAIANNKFEVQMPESHSLEHRNANVELIDNSVIDFYAVICNFMDSEAVPEPYQGEIVFEIYTEDDQLAAAFEIQELTIPYQQYVELHFQFSVEGLPDGVYYIQMKTADGTIIYPAKAPEMYFEMGESAVEGIEAEDPDKLVNVVSVDGRIIKQNVKASEATQGLAPGLYLVGKKKVYVK